MKLSTLIGCSLCLAAGFFTLGRLPVNAQAPQTPHRAAPAAEVKAAAVCADLLRKN